jgi:hypothetical protein
MDIMRPWWCNNGYYDTTMHNGNFPNFPCGAGQKKVMLLLSSWLGNHGYYTLVEPKSLVALPLVIFGHHSCVISMIPLPARQ